MKYTNARELIRDKAIVLASGCWLWTGGQKGRKGYGQAWFQGRNRLAHRLSYEAFRGPIEGETIDHLCRHPGCVNPDHMEVVTNKENILRGNCPSALRARSQNCKYGHPLSGSNLILRRAPKGGHYRRCRACHNRDTNRRVRAYVRRSK